MFGLAPPLLAATQSPLLTLSTVITTSLDRNEFRARVGLRIAFCISWDDLDVVPSQWAYKRNRVGSLEAGTQGNGLGPWWMGNRCVFAFYWWCRPLTGSGATMFLSLWASTPTASFC